MSVTRFSQKCGLINFSRYNIDALGNKAYFVENDTVEIWQRVEAIRGVLPLQEYYYPILGIPFTLASDWGSLGECMAIQERKKMRSPRNSLGT